MAEPRITPGEALFGFIGWLTTRDEPITMSANHDAAKPTDLVVEWMRENDIEMPREGVFANNIKHPKE